MLDLLEQTSKEVPVVFPMHPRTKERLQSSGIGLTRGDNLIFLQPRPYLEFLALQRQARAVVTDSGGIQEETTYLQIPCLTVRENTERPVTIEQGSNVLVGRDLQKLKLHLGRALNGGRKASTIPEYWDGQAGERIASILSNARIAF
jgi:UDP-N-acetylglucosamine 2-epimerase (non-hydrolysing)